MDFQEFLLWEATTRDTVDFKKLYADMADDVLAGLVLSEIVYWHLPNKKGESKLRVEKQGNAWIAVRRYEWWDRIRLSPRQSDRAILILKKAGIIKTAIFKWYGEPTVHISLVHDVFLEKFATLANSPKVNPHSNSPISDNQLPKTGKTNSPKQTNPLTETTPETTTKNNTPEKVLSPDALRMQEFIQAFERNFKVLLSWRDDNGSTGRWAKFLSWAKREGLTAAHVDYAARKVAEDFDWCKNPQPSFIQTNWPRLIDGFGSKQDDNESPFDFSLA